MFFDGESKAHCSECAAESFYVLFRKLVDPNQMDLEDFIK
jgi:hypothetical protein